MKRNFALIIVIVFSLVLSACEDNTKPKDEDSKENSEKVSEEDTMKCPSCEAEIQKDSVYCSECGAKIEDHKADSKDGKSDGDKDNSNKGDGNSNSDGNDNSENEDEETHPGNSDIAQDDMNATNNDGDFYQSSIVEGIDQYVEIFDINELPIPNREDFELLNDIRPQEYTGNVKKRYINSQRVAVRLPFLKGGSDLATNVNWQVYDFTSPWVEDYWSIDYDAYIYNDILSIPVIFNGNYVVEVFNFDISSGEIQDMTSDELLQRIGVEKETIDAFLEMYLRDYLHAYYSMRHPEFDFEQTDQAISTNITRYMEWFNNDYESNNLKISKSASHDGYDLHINFFDEDGSMNTKIGLAPTLFGMALRTKAWNQLGFIYKPYGYVDVPETDIFNKPTRFHTLNDSGDGYPVYFASLSGNESYVELSDITSAEYLTFDNDSKSAFVMELTPKNGISLPQTEYRDIYLYYTMLPEGMPAEAICMDNAFPSGSSHNTIASDMRFGYEFEFVFEKGLIIEYSNSEGQNDYTIDIKSGREFTASGNWSDLGVPITNGKYTNDSEYYYLFPCDEDIQNGANEYYILELKEGTLDFVYGSDIGDRIDVGFELYARPIDIMEEPYYY